MLWPNICLPLAKDDLKLFGFHRIYLPICAEIAKVINLNPLGCLILSGITTLLFLCVKVNHPTSMQINLVSQSLIEG